MCIIQDKLPRTQCKNTGKELVVSGVYEYAKFFIKQDQENRRNTFDGNMKLQKLLVFADLISLAERNVPLFDDIILAYQQGCVIESVRIRYRDNYNSFVKDSLEYNPDFSQDILDVLNLTSLLFGKLSARELSDINHSFMFWKNAYNKSIESDGFRDRNKAIVTVDAMREELDKIHKIIKAYRETQKENFAKETINGIDFYYSPAELTLSDNILDQLYRFSLSACEMTYSVYVDSGRLVVC